MLWHSLMIVLRRRLRSWKARLWVGAAVLALAWLCVPRHMGDEEQLVTLVVCAVSFFGAGLCLLDPDDRDAAAVLKREPNCPHCDYSLTGHLDSTKEAASPELICPECGAQQRGAGLGGYELVHTLVALVGLVLVFIGAAFFLWVSAKLMD